MKQRAFILLSLSVLLLSMFVSLFHPGNALALAASDITGASYAFQDRANITATINGNQVVFTDADINDGTNGYAPATGNGICNTHHGTFGIVIPGNPDWGSTPITGNLNVGVTTVTGANTQCVSVTGQVKIDNTGDKANYKLEYNNGNITTLPGQTNSATYTGSQPNAPSDFYYSSDKNADFCPNGPSALIANGNSGTLYCLQEGDRGVRGSTGASNTTPVKGSPIDGLVPSSYDYISSQQTVGIFGTVGSTPPGATSTSTSTNSSAPSLSCNAGFNPLNWLICGVINGLVGIVGDLDNLITGLLSVGSNNGSATPSKIFCSSGTCNDYYNAWSSFRDIALGLLVVIGLIIVIAEALGVEALDAYTVRKVMPRLVIAVIFITLSWQIMEFFIELSNALGFGIRFLIYKPFDNLNGQIKLGVGGDGAVGLATGAAITAMGIFGLLSFVATAALAVFVAFLVLVIRQLVIIMLVILAPIAILAYILPNTQNVFKIWWDSFSRALMMFPLIAGFIAVGRVFSAVAASGAASGVSGGGTTAVDSLVAFAAYFAPYFLIPATFKFAGGALRQIGGFVNDRHRGAFDRVGKYRQGQVDKNLKATKNYSRFSDNNPLGRSANTFLGATTNPNNVIKGRKGIRAGRMSGRIAQGGASLERDQVYQANKGDDNFLLAIANRDMAKQKLALAQQKYESSRASGDNAGAIKAQHEIDTRQSALALAGQVGTRKSAGTQMTALQDLAKTGYQFDDGEAGYEQLSSSVRNIVGSDDGAYASAMNNAQYNLRTAGKYELAGINHGASYDPKSGTDKASLYELSNAKPGSINGFMDGLDTGPADTEAHAVAYKELQAMLPGAKGATRDRIVDSITTLRNNDVETHMNAPTGNIVQKRITYNNLNPAHATWSSDEKIHGSRIENANETLGDIAQRSARTYERPDPNNL
jgi:hypothetical protein